VTQRLDPWAEHARVPTDPVPVVYETDVAIQRSSHTTPASCEPGNTGGRSVENSHRNVVDMAQQHTADASENDGPVIVIGLLADPGMPVKMAERLADELPTQLSDKVDDTVSWRVEVRGESLVLDTEGDIPLFRTASAAMAAQGWDYLIALTDLPRSLGTQPLFSTLNRQDRTALLSLPAAGWMRTRAHVREAVLYFLGQMANEDPRSRHADTAPREPARLRATELVSSVRRSGPARSEEDHLVLVGLRGRTRMLLGMVLANRPWRLVPSLSGAFAAALATGSFGVFYNSIWTIADALSPLRLALISGFAVTAMTVWLIVYNGLWQRTGRQRDREHVTMNNLSTVCTVGLGVVCVYLLLFVAALAEAVVVIDGSVMEATVGHPVGAENYVFVAWLASSMGTVAGALGSGLEGQNAVHEAAYSKRERERRARFNELAEQDEREDGPSNDL
jgi:hypothetical protein